MPESSLDSGAACPPSPVQILPGDADSSLSAQNKEEELAGDEVVDKEDAEVEGGASAAEELPQSEGEGSAAGTDVPGSPGQHGAAEGAEADQLASLAATADTVSCGEKVLDEEREEEAADSKSENRLEDGKVRDVPVWFWCWLFPTYVRLIRPRLRKALGALSGFL